MARNNNRRKKDIKSKLIAAVCMLLVSTIMMVSSTYAWFTLSTAPEVKGITTSIGSNGALEIALSPADGSLTGVLDAGLTGNQDQASKNLTWGNLLDLGITEGEGENAKNYYGLNDLTLSPTKLAVTGDATNGWYLNDTSPLGTPVYGVDGRITGLENKTSIGGKNADGGYAPGAGAYGVRAVGISSGMSTQEVARKNALSAIGTNATAASNAAGASIRNNQGLITMVVLHAMAGSGTDSTDYSAYIPTLQGLTAELDTSVKAMQNAVRNALLVVITQESFKENYSTLAATIEGAEWGLSASANNGTATGLHYLIEQYASDNTQLTNLVSKIDAVAATVAEAKGKADALTTTAGWNDVSPILNALINTSSENVTVDGVPVKDFKQKLYKEDGKTYNMEYALNLATKGCPIVLGAGTGVYYDIAELAGNINTSASAKIDAGLVMDSMAGTELPINCVISTNCTDSALLVAAKTYLETNIQAAGAGDDSVMDSFYGYVIDLMFRTNAPDSYLQLQTEGAQRIYADGTNTATMGEGATLTFKAVKQSNLASVQGLVESICIAFFDPATNELYGFARVQAATPTQTKAEVKDADGKVTAEAEYTVSGSLMLYNITTATINGNLYATIDTTTPMTSAQLCALDQNTPKAVSCLVYLDGDSVTNADVLYNTNILGALNLQFSSSVNLKPMDYADLKNPPSTPANGGEAGGEVAGG